MADADSHWCEEVKIPRSALWQLKESASRELMNSEPLTPEMQEEIEEAVEEAEEVLERE